MGQAIQPTTIEFAEPVLVKSVVDGDTIEILRNGVEFRIRFKGVNTPELYADAGPEAFAQEARDFVGSKSVPKRSDWSSTQTAV